MSRPQSPMRPSISGNISVPSITNECRWMRIQVSYTFDEKSCLARCPEPILVRTAMLDGSTEVGIVELRSCIDAIVAGSPELVAKLCQDFTIYAYDYSEYETPLVGQGLLSRVLGSSSTTPTAPADQSRTLVTGRVVGPRHHVFWGDISDLLTVKLKLVPVPTRLQGDYSKSMQEYRDMSNFSDPKGEMAAWNAFIRPNSNFSGVNQEFGTSAQQSPPFNHPSPNLPHQPHPLQRISSPAAAPSPYADPQPELGRSSSRAGSRPSTPKRRKSTQARSLPENSSTGGRLVSIEASEPLRKRARVEQTSWQGPSALSSGSESLRVAASTAASIRGHVPPIANSASNQSAASEPPVRPPTPRPSASSSLQSTDTVKAPDRTMYRPHRPSLLGVGSPMDHEYSIASSPESHNGSMAVTPMDMPSSPPQFHLITEAPPSSPPLPALTDFVDSGFGSADLDCLFQDITDELGSSLDEEHGRSVTPFQTQSLSQPALTSELSITEEIPGDPNLLPQKVMLTKRKPQPNGSKPSSRKRRAESASATTSVLPKLAPAPPPSQKSYLTQQQFEASRPVTSNINEIRQAPFVSVQPNSTDVVQVDQRNSAPANDSITTVDDGAFKAKSGTKRKNEILGRLKSDMAAGKMPPFCKNCGEIETPTWRKCYVRHVEGSPPLQPPQDGDEGLLGYDTIEKDSSGNATSYRVLRRSIPKCEKDWEEFKLCNPCGMYLMKAKYMRPSEMWGNPRCKATARKQPVRRKSTPMNSDPLSDAHDAASPTDYEAETPMEEDSKNINIEPSQTSDPRPDYSVQHSSNTKKRPSNSQNNNAGVLVDRTFLDHEAALAALQKAIEQSPPKFPGSQAAPIDLDGDAQNPPINRLLFPPPSETQAAVAKVDLGDAQDLPTRQSETRSNSSKNCNEQNGEDHAGSSHPKTPVGSSPQKPVSGHITSAKPRTLEHPLDTPFTAHINEVLSSDPLPSPTMFSDPTFDIFNSTNFTGAPNDFDLDPDPGSNNEGDITNIALPQSETSYYSPTNQVDMTFDGWYGGPLLDGELDALLREAGDNSCQTYFEANGMLEDVLAELPMELDTKQLHDEAENAR